MLNLDLYHKAYSPSNKAHFPSSILILQIVPDFKNFSLRHTSSGQVNQQSAPFGLELVGSSQTAITPDHTQVGDAQFHQVAGCLQSTLSGSEVFTAGAANDGATLHMKTEAVFKPLTDTLRKRGVNECWWICNGYWTALMQVTVPI